jgi:hypothetical protein
VIFVRTESFSNNWYLLDGNWVDPGAGLDVLGKAKRSLVPAGYCTMIFQLPSSYPPYRLHSPGSHTILAFLFNKFAKFVSFMPFLSFEILLVTK